MRREADFAWSEVGSRIRQRRTARGLSQQALADSAGLTQNAVFRIEAGESNPQISTLQQIAGGLGCTVRELMCGVPETASRLSGRLNRARAVIESGDEYAIRLLDHGIEAAEMLLLRSERKRSIALPDDRKVVFKGDRQEDLSLPSLWKMRPVRTESEADDIIRTTNPEFVKIGHKTIRRSKAST